jgi:hypothetical protein
LVCGQAGATVHHSLPDGAAQVLVNVLVQNQAHRAALFDAPRAALAGFASAAAAARCLRWPAAAAAADTAPFEAGAWVGAVPPWVFFVWLLTAPLLPLLQPLSPPPAPPPRAKVGGGRLSAAAEAAEAKEDRPFAALGRSGGGGKRVRREEPAAALEATPEAALEAAPKAAAEARLRRRKPASVAAMAQQAAAAPAARSSSSSGSPKSLRLGTLLDGGAATASEAAAARRKEGRGNAPLSLCSRARQATAELLPAGAACYWLAWAALVGLGLGGHLAFCGGARHPMSRFAHNLAVTWLLCEVWACVFKKGSFARARTLCALLRPFKISTCLCWFLSLSLSLAG